MCGSYGISEEVQERSEITGNLMLEHKLTVRETAKYMRLSKSTVQKYVSVVLPLVNPQLAASVRILLDSNYAERGIRGGKAKAHKSTSGER